MAQMHMFICQIHECKSLVVIFELLSLWWGALFKTYMTFKADDRYRHILGSFVNNRPMKNAFNVNDNDLALWRVPILGNTVPVNMH